MENRPCQRDRQTPQEKDSELLRKEPDRLRFIEKTHEDDEEEEQKEEEETAAENTDRAPIGRCVNPALPVDKLSKVSKES